MSEDLGQGDKVICVNNTPRPNKSLSVEMCSYLTVNAQYTIRRIVRSGPEKGVHLVEVYLGRVLEPGYFADRFRRVSKRGDFIKLLKKLKKPVLPGLPEGPVRTPTPTKVPEKVE